MTEQEAAILRGLSMDVKQLTATVNDLRLSVIQQLTLEGECRKHVAQIHTEVFGIDGDPNKPGLKGQMRDVHHALDEHRDRLDTIKETYRSSIHRAWTLLTALVGAAGGWLLRHFWP